MAELVEQLLGDKPESDWPLERLAMKLSAVFTGTWSVTVEELQSCGGDTAQEKVTRITRDLVQTSITP